MVDKIDNSFGATADTMYNVMKPNKEIPDYNNTVLPSPYDIKGTEQREFKPPFNNASPYFPAGFRADASAKVRVADGGKVGKPLGDEASPSMDNPENCGPGGKKPNYQHLTTEQFIKRTSKLSNQDFIKAMLEESNRNLNEATESHDDIPKMTCQFTGKSVSPSAFEVSKYMAKMLVHNDRALRLFVRECISQTDALSALVTELMKYSEFYKVLVEDADKEESKFCDKLVNAMKNQHNDFMKHLGLMMAEGHLNEAVDLPVEKRLKDDTDSDDDDDYDDDDEKDDADDEGSPNRELQKDDDDFAAGLPNDDNDKFDPDAETPPKDDKDLDDLDNNTEFDDNGKSDSQMGDQNGDDVGSDMQDGEGDENFDADGGDEKGDNASVEDDTHPKIHRKFPHHKLRKKMNDVFGQDEEQ